MEFQEVKVENAMARRNHSLCYLIILLNNDLIVL